VVKKVAQKNYEGSGREITQSQELDAVESNAFKKVRFGKMRKPGRRDPLPDESSAVADRRYSLRLTRRSLKLRRSK
jgi:hypothetical protein